MDVKKQKMPKRSNIAFCTAIIAASLLYYVTVQSKNRAALRDLNTKLAAEKTQLETDKKHVAELATRSPAFVSGGALEKYLKSDASLADVVGTLAKGDGQSRFDVHKIITEKQEIVNGYTKTLFDIDVDASFPAIGGFLEGLEHSALLTDIQNVEISRMGTELRRCSAKIKLLSYVVKR